VTSISDSGAEKIVEVLEPLENPDGTWVFPMGLRELYMSGAHAISATIPAIPTSIVRVWDFRV
jgi:hypothetical protein